MLVFMDKPARIGLLYSANLGSPPGLLHGIKHYAETQPESCSTPSPRSPRAILPDADLVEQAKNLAWFKDR
jgi:hypothetical protein